MQRRVMCFMALLGLILLAGCSPADVRDLKNAAADSATLVSIVKEIQATPNVPPTATTSVRTKKPTRTATTQAGSAPTSVKRVKNTPGDFDFYVMSLSWSPDYCSGNADDVQQCSLGKKLSFVLHGLWPQYNRGYPADCSNVPLPQAAQQKFPNLYPSSKLYTHEWDKHGTCSGLTPVEYMTLAQSLKESIVLPQAYQKPAKAFRTTVEELKAAFVDANPTLMPDALAVQCSGSGRYLTELRVCFSREGQPFTCSPEVQAAATKSCGQADFLVRNVK